MLSEQISGTGRFKDTRTSGQSLRRCHEPKWMKHLWWDDNNTNDPPSLFLFMCLADALTQRKVISDQHYKLTDTYFYTCKHNHSHFQHSTAVAIARESENKSDALWDPFQGVSLNIYCMSQSLSLTFVLSLWFLKSLIHVFLTHILFFWQFQSETFRLNCFKSLEADIDIVWCC